MSVRFELDLEHGVVLTEIVGDVTVDDLRAYMADVHSHPAYQPSFHRIIDCRAMTRVPSAAEAREISQLVKASTCGDVTSRRAYVTRPGVTFGVARMIEMYAEAPGMVVQVFTDPTAARAWIGLPIAAP